MTNEYTPRRSVLYMPSSNARALEKAKTLPVDALILDLEDAVGPDDKPAAREAACAAVTSGEYGERELTIRINGIGTQWHDEDLAAAAKAGPAGIVVPKVGTADEVRQLVAAMERSGWRRADPVTLRSSWRIVTSTLTRRSYDEAPVSPLFLFGRQQDIAYQ